MDSWGNTPNVSQKRPSTQHYALSGRRRVQDYGCCILTNSKKNLDNK